MKNILWLERALLGVVILGFGPYRMINGGLSCSVECNGDKSIVDKNFEWGAKTLNVANVNGKIVIEQHDRNDFMVREERKSYGRSFQGLESSMEVNKESSTAIIKAWHTQARTNGSINYHILVPAGTAVIAQSENGPITIAGITNVTARTAQGNIEITLPSSYQGGVTISSENNKKINSEFPISKDTAAKTAVFLATVRGKIQVLKSVDMPHTRDE